MISYPRQYEQLRNIVSEFWPHQELSPALDSNDNASRFERDGYLHLEQFIPERLLAHADSLIEEWEESTVNTWINRGLLTGDFQPEPHEDRLHSFWRKAGKPKQPAIRENKLTHFGHQFHSFVCQEKLQGLAAELLKCKKTAVVGDSFFRAVLPRESLGCIPWHQDAQCMRSKVATPVLTIWIPLVDISESNSCLEVGKFHKEKGMYSPRFLQDYYIGLCEEDVNRLMDVQKMLMRRGDILCLHQYIPHRSLLNTSAHTRRSLDIRYRKA